MEFNEYNESVKNWTNGILDNYRKDAELTIRYCHELIDYGEKTADSKILGFGYYHLAMTLYCLNDYDNIFDIVVSAEKKSTFSRLSQNETAKECYQLGFFAPRNADAALAALEMMDFEGIEKVRQRVRQNGTLAQRLEQLQSQLVQLKQGPLSGPGENLSTAAAARAMKGAVS